MWPTALANARSTSSDSSARLIREDTRHAKALGDSEKARPHAPPPPPRTLGEGERVSGRRRSATRGRNLREDGQTGGGLA